MNKNILKSIKKAHQAYEQKIHATESAIQDYCDFEISIFWQMSDGFVVQHDLKNASLEGCLSIIDEKGVLTFEDYLSVCI